MTPAEQARPPDDCAAHLRQDLTALCAAGPAPWSEVSLLGVTQGAAVAGVKFGWRPTGQAFAHVSEVSGKADLGSDVAAAIITYQLQRLLLSADWPNARDALEAGPVTIVTRRV